MAKDHTNILVHEIEETRERLADTIDELLVRSNPKNIAARQVGAVKGMFVDDSGKPKLKTIAPIVGGFLVVAAVIALLRKLGSE